MEWAKGEGVERSSLESESGASVSSYQAVKFPWKAVGAWLRSSANPARRDSRRSHLRNIVIITLQIVPLFRVKSAIQKCSEDSRFDQRWTGEVR